ncbi:hypothetical protein KUCAC02_034591 [Chaenocephalus aceratus]|nr:hypothetical protein KUCAC02_034591 [Chaenocephalus aceratus]
MSAPSNSLQQPRDKSSSCRLHPIRATVPCQPHAGVVEPRTAEAPDSSCPPDAITGLYLSGQWPRDSHGPYPSCMKDKPHRLRGLMREQNREVLTSGQPPGQRGPPQRDF